MNQKLYPERKTLNKPLIPKILGILNVTPDSFSDGGRYIDVPEAVAAAAMLALTEGADTLLNLGVAGGRAAWMHVGTVLQAERAVEPDFDLSAINHTPVGTHDERTQPHFDLVCGDKFPKGVLASADHFQTGADAQLLQALEADVCDMEGASVAHVAWSAGVPCLIFKSISDNANEKGASDYAANCAYALQKLGERMQDIFAESTK